MSRRSDFVRGVATPTAWAWLIALALTAGTLALAERWVASGGLWTTDTRVLYTNSFDDDAHVNYLLHELAAAPPDEYKVVILSASSMREGVLRRSDTDGPLSAALGRPARIYNMSMRAMTYAETLQLLELIGPDLNGIVLVGLSPIKMCSANDPRLHGVAAHYRLPYRAPRMERILREQGFYDADASRWALVLQQAYFGRFVRAQLDRFVHGKPPIVYKQFLYQGRRPWPPAKHASDDNLERVFADFMNNCSRNWPRNAQFIEAIADWRDDTGIPILLFELTLHPSANRAMSYFEVEHDYDAWLTDLRARRNLPYADLPAVAGTKASDFFDYTHIRSGKQSLTRALIDAVAREVTK